MLNFIEIERSVEHPLIAEPREQTSWFFYFKLEPTMFVTRQNMP